MSALCFPVVLKLGKQMQGVKVSSGGSKDVAYEELRKFDGNVG